jgi:hypothetical protein
MTRIPRRISHPLAVIGLVFVLAGCFGGADPTPTPTPEPPATQPDASEPASTAPEPSIAPSEAPASATAAPSFGGGGGFTVMPNPEADALFLDRDECTNPQDGYQVQFPDDWWTNTEIARFPACVWFSPTFYEVVDETQRPDEIAIEIFWVGGDYGWFTEEFSREEVTVGTQRGVRAEIAGTPDDSANGTTYLYVVQLGPTSEEGPNLVARTDTEMGGDYDLNKAVLDRIMATIEFIGTTQ